ncbi:multiple monosaccharide ABC transporter ATP-binding protein [Caproiciproducens galactitolivorans]|uniref:Sugar ABC transporter ATP-binding protein n=1 Tax=Caproiciproducens galactitolivorans TaxID=642589 RepID=A0ABT4BT38_9FIRM|nr:multiple monosaccharide ABC transporter ATP-binding protein [Caproiciproducens galactitolivorans]MCY1713955.1 sugar ABC transporter ATP-binding protein [Caproiciproducens galactitolivorans]
MAECILEMRDIVKEFPGVRVLKNVNFSVEKGSIHALVGENGAGKSTLMNVLGGVYPHGTYTGDIVFDGRVCEFKNIKDSEKTGIAIIHQELALIPYLSIGENLFLGNECAKNNQIDWDLTYDNAKKLMAKVGLKEDPNTLIKDISVGKQQLVEIAKALGKDARLLILDEPTAALTETDSRHLLDLLLELKKNGVTCILISHKLNEITEVSDAITILRDGSTIETMVKGKDEITEDQIIKGMVGREMTEMFPQRDCEIGEVAFEIQNWSADDPLTAGKKLLDNVNMKVHKGEVVGIAGLMGAGRTELALSLFGRLYGNNIHGRILKDGREIDTHTVENAIRNKVAYVTEDRKNAGLILMDDICMNITLSSLQKISKNHVIDMDVESQTAEKYRAKLNIKSHSIHQRVGNLSGGNQQKVVLSKWIMTDPDVLILDEPTRGIDVGAKYEIYTIINQLASEGRCIILISSELPEVLGMSDRVYVMNEGKVVGELSREEAKAETVMQCIMANKSMGA